jgi:predicted PurR-regulated permease PerM
MVLLGTAAAVLVVAGLRSFASTLGPVVLALVLVVGFHPVQGRLKRAGVPAWAATVALLAVVYALLLALAGALALSVVRLGHLLPGYSGQASDLVDNLTRLASRAGVDADQVATLTSRFNLGTAVGLLQTAFTQVTGFLSSLLLLVTLVLFMAFDAAGLPARLAEAARARPDLVSALEGFATGTRRWLLVTTAFGAVVAVLDTLVLYWLGVPLALLWGLLSFVTNYIANIGFVVGLVPPAALGLLEGGPSTMVWVIVAYSVINVIAVVVQPKIVSDAVGLSVTLSFLSVVFWGWVLGPLGALLAIPLSLFTRAVLVDADPGARWLLPLLGAPAEVPSEVRERGAGEPGEGGGHQGPDPAVHEGPGDGGE